MKWKLITSDFETECSECKADIDEEEECYWKKNKGEVRGIVLCISCHKRYGTNQDARNTVTASSDTTTAITSTTVPTPIAPSREQAIAKAHDENMSANDRLVAQLSALTAAIVDLMRVSEDRNKLLREAAKR